MRQNICSPGEHEVTASVAPPDPRSITRRCPQLAAVADRPNGLHVAAGDGIVVVPRLVSLRIRWCRHGDHPGTAYDKSLAQRECAPGIADEITGVHRGTSVLRQHRGRSSRHSGAGVPFSEPDGRYFWARRIGLTSASRRRSRYRRKGSRSSPPSGRVLPGATFLSCIRRMPFQWDVSHANSPVISILMDSNSIYS